MFGTELIRINSLIKTARSAVFQKKRADAVFFCGVSREILKT